MPCCVSVVRRMNIGIASSPLRRPAGFGPAGPYTGCLVEIEQCAAEVQERAEHDVTERERNAATRIALRAEQQAQGLATQRHDDHQSRKRAERMDVVDRAELPSSDERRPERELLDERGGH